MTLTELVTTHNLNLSIRFSTYTEKWYVSIDYIDIKEGPFLSSSVGDHCNTVVDAIESCVKTIRGATLIHHATSEDKRKAIKVPNSLTVS